MWRQRLQLLWFFAVYGYWSTTIIVQDIHDVVVALGMLAFFTFAHWMGKVVLCLLSGGVWVPLIAMPPRKPLTLDKIVKAGKPRLGSDGLPIEPYHPLNGRNN